MNMNKTLTITAIVMVAVVMGMSAITPAMAGNHNSGLPPEDTCDALDNPSDTKSGGNADTGKDKAKEKNECSEVGG